MVQAPPAAPDELSTAPAPAERMRDLRGREHHPWFRRVVLLGMVVVVALALLDVFGQGDRTRRAEGPAASLELRAPSALRGGLLWGVRITVRARVRLERPELVLGPGYVDGMQLNTLEPAPVDESTRGDSLVLGFGTLEAGQQLSVWVQLQVDPDTRGRQDLTVAVEGGGPRPPRPVRLPASAVVFP